jgi:hypothetical protein
MPSDADAAGEDDSVRLTHTPPKVSRVGEVVPLVPMLPRRDRVDLGPGGSLLQAADRERNTRRAGLTPTCRDWRVIAGAAVIVAAAVVLWAVRTEPMLWFGPPGIAALGALLILRRVQPAPAEARLREQARVERRLADRLAALTGYGWTVLHDRLLPDGEHRVGLILAGPGGVIIPTCIPYRGPLTVQGENLYNGGQLLSEWISARWWEARTLNAALAARMDDLPWHGPVYPIGVVDSRALARPGLLGARVSDTTAVPPFPPVWQDLALRPDFAVADLILSFPAPLPREAAAQLAAYIDQVCPPAAVRQPSPAPPSKR